MPPVEKCATGVNDTGGKIAAGINDTDGKFFHHFRNGLMVYSGALGKLIHEKNQKSKISGHYNLKRVCLSASQPAWCSFRR
jgi:hypothetical protein